MFEYSLLTVSQMAAADQAAIQNGVPGLTLMERAGRAVAMHAARLAGNKPIVVLCGPGNNGGDGYVAARYLKIRGFRVRVAALGDPGALKGDALANYRRWQGPVEPLAPMVLEEGCFLVDALFGAGLQRDIDGHAAQVIEAARTLSLPSLAVDLPSGINGNTGMIMGTALPAVATVTFFRKKPGHLLYPGRGMSGDIHVVDIGIPENVLSAIAPKTSENAPALWATSVFGRHHATAHKYDRGHLVIAGSAEMPGAARLAARAARRAGAGLVTLAVPASARDIYCTGDPGNLVETLLNIKRTLEDKRRNAVILGPGLGVGSNTRDLVRAALAGGTRSVVLDADALTSFMNDPAALFGAITGPTVLTPHEGEFKRLFDFSGDKLGRAQSAAEQSGAVIVLKGADSVIAAPDGRAVINANAPEWLGTAGAGDVLAGLIGGFLAIGAPAFEAAAAAVWCHGAAATYVGRGLIAEDIAEALPDTIRKLTFSSDSQY